jgi:hypothetical protein
VALIVKSRTCTLALAVLLVRSGSIEGGAAKTLPLPDSWVDPTVGVKTSVTVAVPPPNKVPIEHRTFEFAGELQLPGELEIDVNVAPDVGRSA